jgi:hypothetical protein
MRVFVGYGFSGRPPPYRTPWGVHLPLCSPFGAPQSAKPCYKWRRGGGRVFAVDGLACKLFGVSSCVCLTFICTHVDTSGFPLYLILSRSNEVDKEFVVNVYGIRWLRNCVSIPGEGHESPLSKQSRPPLASTHRPDKRISGDLGLEIKRPGHEADH